VATGSTSGVHSSPPARPPLSGTAATGCGSEPEEAAAPSPPPTRYLVGHSQVAAAAPPPTGAMPLRLLHPHPGSPLAATADEVTRRARRLCWLRRPVLRGLRVKPRAASRREGCECPCWNSCWLCLPVKTGATRIWIFSAELRAQRPRPRRAWLPPSHSACASRASLHAWGPAAP
jgi:hypothetical protein